jgi:ABC-2 type transport system ATP-binding protein
LSAATPEPTLGPPAGFPVIATLDRVGVAYGAQWALQDVTAAFPAGAVGLLGPNGAGKSTLLNTLLGLLKPDTGRLHVFGLDVAVSPLDVRARIGYLPEGDAHIPGMNAVSFVAYCGELCGLSSSDATQRAHEVLNYVGLGEARYRNVETYSAGMKQRIKLAQALVHDPDLLFLDEPTNGMDPTGRDEMLDLIRDLAHNKGISVVLSSHLLPDVEYTCDHVLVLDRGRAVMNGPIAALKGTGGHVYEVRVKGDVTAFAACLRAGGIECHKTDEDLLRVFMPEGNDPRRLFALAVGSHVQVRHLRPSVPSLEDVFVRAVGEE